MNFSSFAFELTRPLWLLGLVTLPFLYWYFRRSLVDFAHWQRLISLGTRAAVVGLLCLALAGLNLLNPTRQQFVIFAVDRSLSIGDDAQKAAEGFLTEATRNVGPNRYAILPFASEPGNLQLDTTFRPVKNPAASPGFDENTPSAATKANDGESFDNKATDIAASLEVAAAAIPPFYVPKIVLISDGNETLGNAKETALGLQGKVEICSVPLPARVDPEVQLSSVNAPTQVLQGESFQVEVVIDSNHVDTGRLELFRGDVKIVDQELSLKQGETRLSLKQSLEQGGLTPLSGRLRGFKDTLLDNNQHFALVHAAGKPRVLLVESDLDQAKHLTWALEEQDMQVDVRPPRGLPEQLSELQNYDLLILSNVPATSMTRLQMEVARTYVQDLGGGLIMIGGDQSFGLGGYYKTTIEEILPVRSDFEKEKEKPSLAMMLVIDKSGSMGGEKIEMAKEAARAAVDLLGAGDQVGVLAFEGDNFWISELHPCTDKGFDLDRIAMLEAGGGTVMAPAMEEGYDVLRGAVAKLKHMIILTDGVSSPGDFQGIAQAMTADRITVSTVAMGSDADQALLEEIARIGNGRYYVADDPAQVPQIFAKETVTASKSAINEQPFSPTLVRPSQVLNELDLEDAPFLLGYVVTRPKPTSEVILATEAGDPLLAWWRYGLGMSVAFTSDAKSRWAAEWLSWPQFSQFWAQLARHALRKAETKGTVVQVSRQGNKAALSLDAIEPDGRFLNDALTELTLVDPGRSTKKIEMKQTAPGRYATEFDAADVGSYQLLMTQKKNGVLLAQQTRGLAVGYPEELRLREPNRALLQSIAQISGGTFDPKPASIFAESKRSVARATPLWPWLVAIAGILFIFDVGLRRLDLSLLR
jgi:uncharacterized membrane protein